MKSKKIVMYALLSAICLTTVTLIIYLVIFVQPKINFTAQVNKITNEDYSRIINNKQITSSNKGIEKFKHINIQIEIITPLGLIKNVQVDRNLLSKYLRGNDKIQILSGGEFEHSNGKEYADNIEIYLKDISDNELRTLLEEFKYKVSWQNAWNNSNNKIFYLKDYLK